MIDLIRSILRVRRPRWSAASLMSLAGIAFLVGTLYAGTPADVARAGAERAERAAVEAPRVATEDVVSTADEARRTGSAVAVEDLAERVTRVTQAWAEAQAYYDAQVAPIKRVLLRYRNDEALAERVAVSLVREANQAGLQPRLLLAVLLVENPWIDPQIRSPVGAVGLMQVMPLHRGAWSDCGSDLESIEDNICHGARIFAHYFRQSNGDIDRALLRYNGCVRGTNTPNCHQYPNHVFARAGRASVLAWIGEYR